MTHPLLPAILIASTIGTAVRAEPLVGFSVRNIVASEVSVGPDLHDPTLVDGWGIAIRPPANGFGGHFWLSSNGNGTSNQYVGDVLGVPIFQDALLNIDLPPYTPGFVPPVPSGPSTFIPDGQGIARATGQTWQQTTGFVTTLEHLNGTIVNPAKFLFATEDGVISSWTDNRQPDNTPNWVGYAVPVIARAAEGSSFFGITVSNATGYLYTADLGAQPGIKVFNPDFSERTDFATAFNPFVGNAGFQPGDYSPFNVQTLNINGNGNLFVTYQQTKVDPSDPFSIVPGLGQVGDGLGRLVEYEPDGDLVAIWDDRGMLNSPYGFAPAPVDFGLASNMILVGNAGDGTIVAFDSLTRTAVDYLRDPSGEIIHVDGLKGLIFGNGKSLGDANALYFAAGPNGGAEGLMGRIEAVPEPASILLLGATALGAIPFVYRARSRSRKGDQDE